jgi:hypothetical protein
MGEESWNTQTCQNRTTSNCLDAGHIVRVPTGVVMASTMAVTSTLPAIIETKPRDGGGGGACNKFVILGNVDLRAAKSAGNGSEEHSGVANYTGLGGKRPYNKKHSGVAIRFAVHSIKSDQTSTAIRPTSKSTPCNNLRVERFGMEDLRPTTSNKDTSINNRQWNKIKLKEDHSGRSALAASAVADTVAVPTSGRISEGKAST